MLIRIQGKSWTDTWQFLDICVNNIWMFIFNFSQYHRITGSHIVWGWKGPLEIIWSKPLLKQGHLEQAAQDHIHTTFEYLQGGRLQHLCGQPVTFFSDSHSEKVFPNVLCFSVCHCLLLLGTTEHSLALSSLHPPSAYTDELPPEPSHLQAEQPTLLTFHHRRVVPICYMS